MSTEPGSPSVLPQWRALEAHYQEVKDLHLRDLFAERSPAGAAPDGGGGRAVPGLLQAAVTDETLASCWTWPGPATWRPAGRPCSGGRRSTSPRGGRRCTWPCGPRGTR